MEYLTTFLEIVSCLPDFKYWNVHFVEERPALLVLILVGVIVTKIHFSDRDKLDILVNRKLKERINFDVGLKK